MVESTENQQIQNPEGNKVEAGKQVEATQDQKSKHTFHGMNDARIEKNFVVDLQSKKQTWDSLNVPKEIQTGLQEMSYYKPSIIQSVSLPYIMNEKDKNFLFQAINGSGKTGAFGVPSLMSVDPNLDKIQVLIMANTRELIRQIQGVMSVISSKTMIKLHLGEAKQNVSGGHVLITVPGFIQSKLTGRGKNEIDFSALKMIVYDEADELFGQEKNIAAFEGLNKHLKENNVTPQHVLFSATFNDSVIEVAKALLGSYKSFPIKKESLKLKGVKQFKMQMHGDAKLDFIADLHSKMGRAMTMVFVNKKETAQLLQTSMKRKDITATILTGNIEKDDRDKIIDEYRRGDFSTLISTNVLARGIDVPEVDLVINYDVPMVKLFGFKDPDYANYMHRVGRTGRFGTDGVALTLMSENEDGELMDLIAKHYEIDVKQLQSFEQLEGIIQEMRGAAYDI